MILVQINFDYPIEFMGENLTNNAKELAESINHEGGFISKIWLENQEIGESGGIYLFNDQDSAEKYIEMHTKRIKSMGAKKITVKYFTVNRELSVINRGI